MTNGFDRENLYFEVRKPGSKQTALRELAVVRPRNMGEFRAISGVGDAKASRYGKAFLAEIAAD